MNSDSHRILRRGDVVKARFSPTEGSEQNGDRPAIVLSPEIYNRRSSMVVLAPLTSQNTDRIYAYEALIPSGDGVPLQSKALLPHLRGMSKSRILSFYGHVSDETMQEVDAALKIAVGLEKI